MKLFGNSKQSKYSKGSVRRQPAAEELRMELPAQEAAPKDPEPKKTPARLYTKNVSIFDYAELEPSERRHRMQEDYRNTPVKQRKKSRRKKCIRALIALLIVAAVLASLYLVAVYSQLPFVRKWRDIYIQTAMSTLSHKWLATAFIPKSVIDECVNRRNAMLQAQIDVNSTDPPTLATQAEETEPEPTVETMSAEELAKEHFYEVFWELDQETAEQYFRQHPDAVKDGYDHIRINEAGLKDDGTSIYTTMGEQVLAIDAENEVLLVRVWLDNSRGVLAIAKDPSLLKLCPSGRFGSYGQHAGEIAQNNNGLLAITASGFDDPEGHGNGGLVAGYCKCDGEIYNSKHRGWGIKRLELKENNWLYINDAPNDCGDDVTDAMEFEPALVVNGKQLSVSDYTSLNPRACLGQSKSGEILMIVVEGRFVDSPGCSVELCAEKLMEHKCLTAMNLDGGTSAILWYDGEVVTRCSNTRTPEGRYLPNAWVYTYKTN